MKWMFWLLTMPLVIVFLVGLVGVVVLAAVGHYLNMLASWLIAYSARARDWYERHIPGGDERVERSGHGALSDIEAAAARRRYLDLIKGRSRL